MSTETPPPITQLEMSEQDIEFAERIAKRLGYSQTAYTSTSGLWGLFCLRENPQHIGRHIFRSSDETRFDSNCSVCGGKDRGSVHSMRLHHRIGGCIIKTADFGFVFVADLEDLQLHDLHEESLKVAR